MSLLVVQLNSDQLSEIIESAVKNAIEKIPQLPTREEPEKPLTIPEAAEYLSLSVPTIYTLISKGHLPAKKRSKRVYFFASDLNNYLKAGGKKMVIKEKAETDPGKQVKKVLTAKIKSR